MEKKATIYVVDCGNHMASVANGRKKSDIEWVKEYLIDNMANSVLYNRKTDEVGVLAVGNGCRFVHDFGCPTRQSITAACNALKVQDVQQDVMDGVFYALNALDQHCRKLKYSKSVYVLTNQKEYGDEASKLLGRLSDLNCKLMFAIVGFDSREPPKGCNSLLELEPAITVAPYDEAAATVGAPKPKSFHPQVCFKGFLELGNPNGSVAQLRVEVNCYPAVRKTAAPTASMFHGPELDPVKIASEHLVDGEPRVHLDRGYLYGSELVVFDAEDRALLRGGPRKNKSMEIIGFVSRLDPWVAFGPSNYVLPATSRDALALDALVRALDQCDCVALARYVPHEGSDIELVELEPFYYNDTVGFLLSTLPFEQDFNRFELRLDGDTRQPNEAMEQLMDSVIADMSFDDEYEVVQPSELNHRVFQFIKSKALPDLYPTTKTKIESRALDSAVFPKLEAILDIKPVAQPAPGVAAEEDDYIATTKELDINELLT